MARCIFLDIDGVLNSHRTAVAFQSILQRRLDPVAVMMLYRLVTCADAAIVISSTWRLDDQWLTTIWGCLREAGWPWNHTAFLPLGECPIIDRTPRLPGVRGIEIQAWLDANPEYDDYIILDDDSDMLESQMDRFIHCPHYVGFDWDGWLKIRELWPEVDDRTRLHEVE